MKNCRCNCKPRKFCHGIEEPPKVPEISYKKVFVDDGTALVQKFYVTLSAVEYTINKLGRELKVASSNTSGDKHS